MCLFYYHVILLLMLTLYAHSEARYDSIYQWLAAIGPAARLLRLFTLSHSQCENTNLNMIRQKKSEQ